MEGLSSDALRHGNAGALEPAPDNALEDVLLVAEVGPRPAIVDIGCVVRQPWVWKDVLDPHHGRADE